MKRAVISVLIIIAAVIMISGCSGDGGASLTADDVTGTWVQILSDGTETLTLNADMTYEKVIELTSEPPLTTRSGDTYTISGNKIIINYSKYGTSSEYKVTIDGDVMKWDSGSGTIEYRKK